MANERILIVDDDTNICELLRLYLEKDGFQTDIVTDGIGVPILLSISWGGNIGIIDFNAFSCSNIKATPFIPNVSK